MIHSCASNPTVIVKYRPDIDGLRALAVLSVVFYHAFPRAVTGGFVGVDIFFVISGYLISLILFVEFAHSRFSLAAFYGRRIRRIFPALALCLAAVVSYGFICLIPSELAQVSKHVFFGAAFLSNIALWAEAGYFDSAASLKPLLHLWSLGIEEQFYIVWPAMLCLLFRWKANVGILLLGMFLASFVANIVLSLHSVSDDFYLPMSRFWELLVGAGLAWHGEVDLSEKSRTALSWTALTILLLSVAVFAPEMHFPGWLALLPVAGAAMVILVGPKAAANRWVFSNPAAVWIGLISYPLYIWHWPLLSFAYIIRLGRTPTPLMAAALVAVAILLAWGTYRFVELPMRFGNHHKARTTVLVATIVVLGAVGAGIWIMDGLPGRFPALPGIDARKISIASAESDFKPTAGMAVENHNGVLIARLGNGPSTVVLSGDSVLFQYGPRVQQLADEGKLTVEAIFITGAGCAPVPGVVHREDFARCSDIPRLLQQAVRRTKPQSLVLGSSWSNYYGLEVERHGKRLHGTTSEGKDAFWANLTDLVRSFRTQGVAVYLVRGAVDDHYTRLTPREMMRRSPFGFQVDADMAQISVAELRKNNAVVDAHLSQVAAQTGATLLDAIPDICGEGDSCSGLFGMGEPKFIDGMHLRTVFVKDHVHFLDFLLTKPP